MAYTTVLVGIDGSPAALHAVDRAAYAAKREDAKLVLVCAYHPMAARDMAARTTGLADTKYRVTGTDAAQQALDAALLRPAGPARASSRDGWSRRTPSRRCWGSPGSSART